MPATRLWDLPVRLAHWSYVVLIGALWWSAENGKIDLHVTLGLIMLGIVVFRLLWGLVGSSTARFSSFVKGPRAVIAYVKGLRGDHSATPVVGHNALGGWSVLALLGLLALQVGLGLFAQDTDGQYSGPLNHLVSYNTGETIGHLHGFVFNVILGVAGIHIAAIAFYLFVKKDNLVRPMVTGSRTFAVAVDQPAVAPLWRALVCAVLAALLAVWLGYGAPTSLAQLKAQQDAPKTEDYM